jgi:hypothetical protein
MDLLKYEFIDAPGDSYNGYLKQLVANMRYNYSMVSADEFQAAIPQLQRLESKIQRIDSEIGREERQYLQELLAELGEESELEEKILSAIERSARAIIATDYQKEFSMEEYNFLFRNSQAVSWIDFFGYQDSRDPDIMLFAVRDIFKSVCYKFGIIFIDSIVIDNA